MSLESWEREFYKTPASKTSRRFALKHSLRKWIGLLSKNRRKHKVTLRNCVLFDNNNELEIDASSCALCKHYEHDDCVTCPLFTDGKCCYGAYSKAYDNRVVPMIKLLKKALEFTKKP